MLKYFFQIFFDNYSNGIKTGKFILPNSPQKCFYNIEHWRKHFLNHQVPIKISLQVLGSFSYILKTSESLLIKFPNWNTQQPSRQHFLRQCFRGNFFPPAPFYPTTIFSFEPKTLSDKNPQRGLVFKLPLFTHFLGPLPTLTYPPA